MIEIYTDGAYSPKRNQGGVGIVILKDGKMIQKFSKAYNKNVTNNKMELLAVILALNSIKQNIENLTIYTDSMYVIGCATKGWKKKKNVALWSLYDKIFKQAQKLVTNEIKFIHVKGHADCKWNNLCDSLAVAETQILI